MFLVCYTRIMIMKTPITLLFALTVIILSGCSINSDMLPTMTGQCAEIGETTGAKGMLKMCCSGLTPMGGWPGGYQGKCSLSAPGGLAICSDCGNNICDTEFNENVCNCPKDCTQ